MINNQHIPLRLNISITPRCNSKCRMCHFWHTYGAVDTSFDLPLTKILQAITHYDVLRMRSPLYPKYMYRVNISGGEPLLRFADVVEIAQYCRTINIPLIILTNGLLLQEHNFRELLDQNISCLALSAESDVAEENDDCRGVKGHFEHIVKIIPLLKAYIEANELRTVLGLTVVITKRNCKKLSQIAEYFRGLGIDHVTTQFLDTHIPPDRELPKNVSQAYRQMLEFARVNAVARTEVNYSLQSDEIKETCGAKKFFSTTIQHDGSIMPCAHLFNFAGTQQKMQHMNLNSMTLLDYFDDKNFKCVEEQLKVCKEARCAGYHFPCYNH